jgi:hypothetical protein
VLLAELTDGASETELVVAVKSMLTQFQKELTRFSIPVRLDSEGLRCIRERVPTNHNPPTTTTGSSSRSTRPQ